MVETDPFSRTQSDIKQKDAKSKRTYEKVYREVMLGGGHINSDMQQFLEMDKKVLRFFAIMDDLGTPQFERRPFIVMFFLWFIGGEFVRQDPPFELSGLIDVFLEAVSGAKKVSDSCLALEHPLLA